jgi:hypothetical protein
MATEARSHVALRLPARALQVMLQPVRNYVKGTTSRSSPWRWSSLRSTMESLSPIDSLPDKHGWPFIANNYLFHGTRYPRFHQSVSCPSLWAILNSPMRFD